MNGINLEKHRHPWEHFVLLSTIGLLSCIIIFTGLVSVGIFSATILFFMLISIIKNQSTMKKYIRTAKEVTPESDHKLWQLFSECKQIIPVHENTNMYILDSPVLNAYAIGFFKPCQIVLTTAITNQFTDDEIKSIIGHELGHIYFGHTRWALLTGVFEGQYYGISGLQFLIRFIFLFYSRLCEYSADRAGLLACQKLKPAISAELKLNLSGESPDKNLVKYYMNDETASEDSVMEDIFEMSRTHPTMKGRINALLKYVKTPAYLNKN